MRILEINAYYNYGSTGAIVKDICDKGLSIGYEMFAIYWLHYSPDNTAPNVIYCGENEEPSSIYKLCQWVFDGGKLNYNKCRTLKIIEYINLIKPDIIHLHNMHGDFAYGMLDIEQLFKAVANCHCKVIWTLHDMWPITGRCYYYYYSNCEKWKKGCGNCPQRFYDKEGIFWDRSAYNLKTKKQLFDLIKELTIVCVSNWLSDVTHQSILNNRRIVTIYNGIDRNTFTYNQVLDKHEGILCIGWGRRKGYEDYIEIAKLLPQKKVYVIGERPFFRRFRKLPSNLHEIQYINNKEELATLYNKMSVYFNASRSETFGLTTAEALGCGLPVIGYRNTATPEIIGDYGICIENNNIEKVAKAVEKLELIDSNLLRIKRCEYAHKFFSKEQMVEGYMELFSEC